MENLVSNQNTGVITLKEITDLITTEHNKAMKVAAMICEGKIKISDEINKIED